MMPYHTTYKYVFRKLDHIMILLAIAGTYTPICLVVLHNWVGYTVLAIEWAMVLAGVLLKSIAKTLQSFVDDDLHGYGMDGALHFTGADRPYELDLFDVACGRRRAVHDRDVFLLASRKKLFPFYVAYLYYFGEFVPFSRNFIFYVKIGIAIYEVE